MSIVIVTGAGGLIGSQCVRHFSEQGYDVIGIDNNMRRYFFGEEGSTAQTVSWLMKNCSPKYTHTHIDIRDQNGLEQLFKKYNKDISLVVHTAAQPSHDWAAREPMTDFTINANGTLNLLEEFRKHCPEAVFIYTSTNKVYGDHPNRLPIIEKESRYAVDPKHPYHTHGIDEQMSLDQCLHSLFGVSKCAADLLVQEYGRYFHLKTAVFRGGCLTGPWHAGAPLHGFLSYLVKCAVNDQEYTIIGYKGKQVRDNIHSYDFVNALDLFFKSPKREGAVYNMGGGLKSNCSILEAIDLLQQWKGRKVKTSYHPEARIGDHIWYISDLRRFEADYPQWKMSYNVEHILREIYDYEKQDRLAA